MSISRILLAVALISAPFMMGAPPAPAAPAEECVGCSNDDCDVTCKCVFASLVTCTKYGTALADKKCVANAET